MKKFILLLCTTPLIAMMPTYDDIVISASYIYWVPSQDGLAIAYDVSADADPKVLYPQIEAKSGFKVGAGITTNCWLIKLNYQWFGNTNNPFTPDPKPNLPDTPMRDDLMFTLYSTWYSENGDPPTMTMMMGETPGTPVAGVTPSSSSYDAISKWDNYFQRLDLTTAMSFCPGRFFRVTPRAGLLSFWDSQDLKIRYRGVDRKGATTSATFRYEMIYWDVTQDSWGIGPYMGTCLDFMIHDEMRCDCFSIFLSYGASLPWKKRQSNMTLTKIETLKISDYTDPEVYFFYPPDGVDSDDIRAFSDPFWIVAPMIEASLGISWETSNYKVSISWDNQLWFNHNGMFDYESNLVEVTSTMDVSNYNPLILYHNHRYTRNSGSYSTQGLTISALMGF